MTFRRAGEATQARHMLNGRHVCGHEVKVRKGPVFLSIFFQFCTAGTISSTGIVSAVSTGTVPYFRIAVNVFD